MADDYKRDIATSFRLASTPRDIQSAFLQRDKAANTRPGLPFLQRRAGVNVTHETALTYSAFWAGVRVIAETMGTLPCGYFEVNDGTRVKLRDDPIARLLRRPNPEMTAMTLKEIVTAHCCSWGNGYLEIERDRRGTPIALWPLLPDRTRPWRDANGVLWYLYQMDGEDWPIPAKDVVHIKGLGFDGLVGYDVVSFHAMTLGVGIAAQEYTGGFFGNGAHISGALVHPEELGEKARENIRRDMERVYGGPGNAFKLLILEEGLEYKSLSVAPVAAQLIEQRKFNVTDTTRVLRLQPHKIGDMEKATFSNIEHQNIEFKQDTMTPWAVKWESELEVKLIPENLRDSREIRFNMNALARGDQKSRYEAYKIGREWGWLNANGILELEDMDPIPGAAGEMYIVPLNFQRADLLAAQTPEDDSATEPVEPQQEANNAIAPFRVIALDCAERVYKREQNIIAKAWERASGDSTSFHQLLSNQLEGQESYCADMMRGIVLSATSQFFGEDATDELADELTLKLAEMYRQRQWCRWSDAFVAGQQPDMRDRGIDLLNLIVEMLIDRRSADA